jgi:hypothetical protein
MKGRWSNLAAFLLGGIWDSGLRIYSKLEPPIQTQQRPKTAAQYVSREGHEDYKDVAQRENR